MASHLERLKTRLEGSSPSPAAPEDPLTTKAVILSRRKEENLPWFGELVAKVSPTELVYHQREDARNIELFFDLFFVAIFSTFTKNHEINSNESLSSYAVYFGVIWASWLQISLFDVRFGMDSLFERFIKATQFVAFIGFASATGCLEMGNGDKYKKQADLSGFESLNALMIVSRFVFAVQYAVAAILVGTKHRAALAPLLMTSAMYAFVSFVYGMLLKFFLLDQGETQSFYGYYAVIAFELFSLSYINSRYKCISFTDTPLHKRVMCLTLMILGEGIIVCAFTFAKISAKTGWTANTFAQALCVILSIYFMYCLYFGNSGIERARHFHAWRQQLYTMLHLPFHLALALTLEGLRTWTIIDNVQYNFKKISGYLDKAMGETPSINNLDDFSPAQGSRIASILNDTVQSLGFEMKAGPNYIEKAISNLNATWNDDPAILGNTTVPGIDGTPSKTDVLKFYFQELVSLVQNEQFRSNSLYVPDVQVKAANGSGQAQMDAYSGVFRMIFIYFFVCAGLVMIFMAIFRKMSMGPRDHYDHVMIITRFVVGLTLGFLALMGMMSQKVVEYIDSGVLLPTLLFSLIFVVSFEKILTNLGIWRSEKDTAVVDLEKKLSEMDEHSGHH